VREKHRRRVGEGVWRGEKTSGVKAHAGVDANGSPHAVRAAGRGGAVETLRGRAPNLPKAAAPRDGGCGGENSAGAVKALTEAGVEAVKRNELHTFAAPPKRRAVGRTFGRLEKHRRLWKNCERKIHTTLQMTVPAFISLLLKRY
jgi:hypothetical protein